MDSVHIDHKFTDGGSAYTSIPDGCDLVTVQVPTGATFAHSTNGKILLEFEGVCDKLLDTEIYVKQYPGNVLLRRNRR